jgi:adenosine deaminase
MGDFSSAFTGARIALFGGEIVAELGNGIVVTGTKLMLVIQGLVLWPRLVYDSQSTLEGCPSSNISCGIPTKQK